MPTGVEIVESVASSAIVSVPSAIILVIGTAPIGDVNVLTYVQSANADSVFGFEVPGFTIPKALAAIRKQSPNARCLVINVADASMSGGIMTTSVTNEARTLVAGATQLNYAQEGLIVVKDATLATTYILGTDYTISPSGAFARVGTAIGATDVIKVSYLHLENHVFASNKITLAAPPFIPAQAVVVYNVTKTVTYVLGTDYALSPYGVITRITSGAITSSQNVMVKYATFDGIVAADIIGTASPRTGLYCIETSNTLFGFEPTIYDCPGYIELAGVLPALIAAAENIYGGTILLDIPSGLTIATAETARGAGSGSILDISNERVLLVGPRPNVFDIATNANEERYLSSFVAGAFAAIDTIDSPARSLHNHPKAVIGIESLSIAPMTWDQDYNRTTDVSRLNDVEILTLDPRMRWSGTKNSRFRNDSGIMSNYNVRRVADIISRSLIVGAYQFIGQNINPALVDAIVQNAQGYIDGLTQKDWIVSGKAFYNAAHNSTTELALGHVTIDLEIVVQIATERLTYNISYTTPSLLAA